ncbi:MAG TPA: tRNA preQ1(34) S-adenosylmethionine ribosyltransferase-isomerase QueA [Steroidobacteraceae bacterium]|jgi:S-adenosylmethionine:tRNA ribosyltransferase-isomerase|nr:tRNA preQ1(34) S-adenosylmethionine ribosyltransferase-isomerase QueA [Steroidobacteraceae bacterium]
MLRTDFHFELPQELIAQRPASVRSASRMLVLDGAAGSLRDLQFRDLPSLLNPKDLLVFNDTRVIAARVFGRKESGGRVEILLERALTARTALVHLRASKGLKEGAVVRLPGGESAHMLERQSDLFHLQFSCDVLRFFEAHGEMPLPPYITRAPEGSDRERYQTVYARTPGAIAAPTAGLHFDADIFAEIELRQVRHAFVTLHVGAGTFQPVRTEDIDTHEMHEEYLEVPEAACAAINNTRAAGGRVIAVGTTVVRSLETAAGVAGARLMPYRGSTRIFIKPGHKFRAVDAMLTNFHLPESTLLMLCSAFVGREALLQAYAHAVRARYRFFSYGDAMFLTPTQSALAR